jgi:glycerophosphoryl diester phosphodiesterase
MLMTCADLRGMPVVVWTVNDPDEAGRLIDLGVSGIVTDYPDRLREVWRARGMPLPDPPRRAKAPAPAPALQPAVAAERPVEQGAGDGHDREDRRVAED